MRPSCLKKEKLAGGVSGCRAPQVPSPVPKEKERKDEREETQTNPRDSLGQSLEATSCGYQVKLAPDPSIRQHETGGRAGRACHRPFPLEVPSKTRTVQHVTLVQGHRIYAALGGSTWSTVTSLVAQRVQPSLTETSIRWHTLAGPRSSPCWNVLSRGRLWSVQLARVSPGPDVPSRRTRRPQ